MTHGVQILNGRNSAGTGDERPNNADIGFTYWNTDAGKLQVWDGSDWKDVGGPGAAAPAAAKPAKAKKAKDD